MVRSCDLSSPDPLGLTQENLGTVPPLKRWPEKSGATPKKPLANTSHNRVQDFYLTTPPSPRTGVASPFKLVAEAGNPASPWRIRVTVEAEQENTQDGQPTCSDSPVKHVAERTTTTKIPLKDADEQSPIVSKKGRGRPKKSMGSPGNRVGTPKGKKSATPKQKSAGPRDKVPTSTKNLLKETGRRNPTPSKRGRGRPRKLTEGHTEELELQHGEGEGLVDILGVDHPMSLETNRTAHARSQGPTNAILSTNSDLSVNSTGLDSEGVHDEEQPDLDSIAMTGSSDKFECYSNLPDPTDEHEEFDSILESEGFSMVSVSSLPSARLHSSSPFECDIDGHENALSLDDAASLNPASLSNPKATSPALSGENSRQEIQETYSQKASSLQSNGAPIQQLPNPLVRQTPSVTCPTTAIPPVIKTSDTRKSPQALDKASDGTPKLVRVVRACAALQGVLSPQSACTRSGNTGEEGASSLLSPAKSPKERLVELFSGFGAGTRRELRAGLRLGEELAKRHQIVPQVIKTDKSKDDVFGHEGMPNASKLPSGAENVGYSLKVPELLYPTLSNSQLPSPAGSEADSDNDRMSWKVNTPNAIQAIDVKAEPQTQYEGVDVRMGSDFEGSTIAREEEEYRLEREAVIRQIQAANSSQVIVINSDSEDEYEDKDEDDIWQEQFHSSEIVSAPVDSIHDVLLPTRDSQPRRSQLPSPWRRQSDVASASRIPGNSSDSFWQPSRFIDNTSRRENLAEGKSGQNLQSQDSQDTSHFQDFGGSIGDSTFEPESMLHISPVKQNIQVAQKASSTAKQGIPISSVPGEDEYNMTRKRLSGEMVKSKEQLTREWVEKKAPQTARMGGKMVEAPSSEQRETVSFVPRQSVEFRASTWVGYLASFVPVWGEAAAAAGKPHRLPNGKSKLPRAGSLEGPLSRYMPWTTGHYNALYFHYAASKEGRHRYGFNAKSASARYLGRIVRYRGWERPVTKEDLAIVDAFMVDLKAREASEDAAGDWKIDEEVAVFKVFTLWHGGVQRGECEAGIGKTGLVEGSETMWRADMELWYHKTKE